MRSAQGSEVGMRVSEHAQVLLNMCDIVHEDGLKITSRERQS